MKDLRREIQPEGLEKAQLEDLLEEEMAEGIIPKVHKKGMKGIIKWKSGQILQVKGEGGMLFICIPLQPKVGI